MGGDVSFSLNSLNALSISAVHLTWEFFELYGKRTADIFAKRRMNCWYYHANPMKLLKAVTLLGLSASLIDCTVFGLTDIRSELIIRPNSSTSSFENSHLEILKRTQCSEISLKTIFR